MSSIYKAIRRHNTVQDAPDDNPSILEELYEKFKSMSPKERNDALQALYSAHLAGRETLDETTLALFKVLMSSFNVSIKFEELEGEDNGDQF